MGTGWEPAAGNAGAGARTGPCPESVAVVAQRLAALAGELEGVRLQLGAVETPEWRSPAAAAFLTSLTDLNVALATAVKAFEEAAGDVGSYGLHLRASSLANGCFSPLGAGSGAGSGAGQAIGAAPGFGLGVGPGPVFGGLGTAGWGP
ncbi:hypothetical protein ART_2853 [Arthrobacter sp. PAMC 25486]|nr:hypothetical protein ART_2853 [Arthrobacter sp. PAMC 25486]